MFQQKISGSICTVDFVRNSVTGQSFCVPREELLRTKNGAGTTVQVFHDEKLEQLVAYIGEKINIQGVVNMEFIKNEKGYFLIDVNPRFSAGIAFSCKTGYDFINAHLDCFTGVDLQAEVKIKDRIFTKYYVE